MSLVHSLCARQDLAKESENPTVFASHVFALELSAIRAQAGVAEGNEADDASPKVRQYRLYPHKEFTSTQPAGDFGDLAPVRSLTTASGSMR